jgi:hypothetical protein
MIPKPNQPAGARPNTSGAVYGATAGISRNMNPDPLTLPPGPQNQGGGNLNGTQATSILFSHAGTTAQQIALPRRPMNSGNYCGVV